MNKNLAKIGLGIADFLIINFKKNLIYEKLTKRIYKQINSIVEVVEIGFYVIDEDMKNFNEEVIYNYTGWIPGFNCIPLDELPSELIVENKVIKYKEHNYHYLQFPLFAGSQILGLLEIKSEYGIEEEKIEKIKDLLKAISLGLKGVLFEADTIREAENTELSIKINNELQSIDDLDLLVDTFLKMTVNYFKFDRVTVFIFDENKKIDFARGITESGMEYTVDDFNDLPELAEKNIIEAESESYWFPLKTNTGLVGVVLFDNLYTTYEVSDSLLNNLRVLTTQFANAIHNIRMFSSLQQSAYFDSLTGLYNRTYLKEVLPEYNKEENLPLSVIIGDLNGLKVTNDVFGHSAGDNLLKKTAEILEEFCPENACIIRWGGDEFFVLLPKKNAVEANNLIQKIKEKCSKVDDIQVKLSIALGSATRKSMDIEISSLMKKAEDKMYREKSRETKNYHNSLISSFKRTLNKKSHESDGHIKRMTKLAVMLGQELGLSDSELNDLRLLAVLHDVGKVAIDAEILNKEGSLSDQEWEEIKKHPEAGYRIAQTSQELTHVSKYILHHHERWDGKGYPLGKKGKEIPLLSRIIAVIDAYDVMTHKRTYKDAINPEEALNELKRCAGTQFDPDIVELFQKVIKDEYVLGN